MSWMIRIRTASAGLGILSVTDGRPDVCTEGFLVSFRLQSLISNDADLF